MDPNANLREQLKLANQLQTLRNYVTIALDEWQCKQEGRPE